MFDSTQLLLNAATTATFTGTAINVLGGVRRDQTWKIVVPQATGTSPTADCKLQDSADNSTFNDLFTFRQITAAGIYRCRVFTDRKYVRLIGTVGGTTPNFGTVVAGPVPGSEYTQAQKQ